MQEKESIISVRYGQTNLSLGSLFLDHSAEPRDAKTVTLGTHLSVHTSHSCQILIIFSTYPYPTGTCYLDSNQSLLLYEPCHEKTCLWGLQPGPKQIWLYSHRRWLEARNFGFRKIKNCTTGIYAAKTKALIT